jgi:zinc/manganese transport system substrate-binding protein
LFTSARDQSRLSRAISLAIAAASIATLALVAGACSSGSDSHSGKKSVVVTYTVLGSLVSDLVGDSATVTVMMPNGSDVHEWAPSARDIEKMTHADLLVENGLNLEGGMGDAFTQAEKAGVKIFLASDYITVRHVAAGQGVGTSDPDQAVGAADPHLWMNPLNMKKMVAGLATTLKSDFGMDLSSQATDLENRLTTLDGQVAAILNTVPQAQRTLVTGHESLGYFAEHYNYQLVGAIVPSLTTQAETSTADLASLEAKIKATHVKAIFTEMGTDPKVAQAVGADTGAKVVELTTHALPSDGSYLTFLTNIAHLLADNLK